MGLYDSETGRSVEFDKAVDVTHLCLDSLRCVVKYGNAKRGRIAQICDWYEQEKDMGTTVHFFISEMTPMGLAGDVVFNRRARVMHANPFELAKYIYDNQ